MDLDRHSTDGAVGLLEEGKVVLYWQRWWWLAVYFVVTVCNAMTFITFGPIDVTSAAFFEQGLLAINVTTGVGTVFSILFMLPILAFVKRFGLGTTMRLSSACNVVAGAVRIVAPFLPVSVGAYFWILFGSQVVAMVANPPLTAVVPELSSHWFPPSEVTRLTAFFVFSYKCFLRSGQSRPRRALWRLWWDWRPAMPCPDSSSAATRACRLTC